MSRGRESFAKTARLTKRSEFVTLSRGGQKFHTPHFVVISKPNDKGASRLGVTVSSRVGNAVVRNRIKRLFREFFRRHRHKIPSHHDIVIIAKKGAEGRSSDELTRELRRAFFYRDGRQG